MKQATIGYVLKGYPRLSETFIAQEIHQMEQMGFALEIFSMRKAREKEQHPIISEIKAPVTYIPEYFRDAPFEIAFSAFAALIANPLATLGAFAHALREVAFEQNKSSLKRFFQAAWLVRKKDLGRTEIRHLHAHFVHTPTELTLYAHMLSGLTYSISAHAKDIYTSSIRQVTERIQRAEFLMTCTRFNVNYLRRQPNIPSEKVHEVYHGIHSQRFTPGPLSFSKSGNHMRLVTCARLVPKKGYPTVLQAMAKIRESGYPLHYDIFGEGELRESLVQLAENLGIADYVHFHGNITQAELIAEYQKQGIFVLGCQEMEDGDRDGIPNAMAEAMSMGLPVIATNISGIPELAEHGVSALLVPSRDVTAMIDAIYRLISRPELGDSLGESGRARVQSVFEAKVCAEICASFLRPYSQWRPVFDSSWRRRPKARRTKAVLSTDSANASARSS